MLRRFTRSIRIARSTAIDLERTSTGLSLTVARRIDAPSAVVWDLLVDTRRWPEWGPSITSVESSNRVIEPGTRGTVRLVGGLSLPFGIETCADGRWTWRIRGVRATGHRVEPTPIGGRSGEHTGDVRHGRCRAVFEIPLAAAPYAVVCLRALSRIESLARENCEPNRADSTDRGP